jgi:hypothetical protein
MNKVAEITQAVVDLLVDETEAQDRVFNSLADDLNEDQLPAISVSAGEETPELLCPNPRAYRRVIPVEVQIFLKGPETEAELRAALSAMAAKIEGILDGEDLGGLISEFEQTSTPIRVEVKGNSYCSAVLKFQATYYT